jgi:peptidoglycan/xylan/chitin deacetylase (PgdA/CDA1 family)
MRVVSPLLRRVVYPALSGLGLFRRIARSGPMVVTYHGIFPRGYRPRSEALDGNLVSAEMFRQHLRLLKSKYNLISPDEFLQFVLGREKLPRGSVLLTCDDGLLNVLTDMLPILAEVQAKILVFLTGASAGDSSSMLWYEKLYLWLQETHRNATIKLPGAPKITVATAANPDPPWRSLIRELSCFSERERTTFLCEIRTQLGISENWDSEYSQDEILRRRFFVVNAAQLRVLTDAGVTIGAHTLSHSMLSQMPESMAYMEMAESRTKLQEASGERVWAFAYPFGDSESVGNREPGLARQAGFDCAFINTESDMGDAQFAVPRIHVSSATGVAELDAHVSGFYRSLKTRF